MSQYGGQQQQYSAQGGYGGQQDPSQQDPSQSQYGQQQDPNQQDPSQPQYGQQQGQANYDQKDPSQQDPSQTQYGGQQGQANGYPSNAPGQADPSQQQGYGRHQQMHKPKHDEHAVTRKSGSGRAWDAKHHNALYHQAKVAAGGFTKDHMESFIHLGTYALGALSNQHGLAPDAPAEDAESAVP